MSTPLPAAFDGIEEGLAVNMGPIYLLRFVALLALAGVLTGGTPC